MLWQDISNILLEINVVDLEDFNEKTISNEKIIFLSRNKFTTKIYYNSCKAKEKKSPKFNRKKQKKLLNKKKISQPNQIKTCGSTFKIFSEEKSLVTNKESGCDQFKEGDAAISENIVLFC